MTIYVVLWKKISDNILCMMHNDQSVYLANEERILSVLLNLWMSASDQSER